MAVVDPFDVSIFGELTQDGSLVEYTGVEALQNALTMWITSFRRELLRKPAKGGYIMNWIMKPMSEQNAQNIKDAIVDGLEEDFTPRIIVRKIDVIPVYSQDYWDISIEIYSPDLQENFTTNVQLNSLG